MKIFDWLVRWVITPTLCGIVSYSLVPYWWVAAISTAFALGFAWFVTSKRKEVVPHINANRYSRNRYK